MEKKKSPLKLDDFPNNVAQMWTKKKKKKMAANGSNVSVKIGGDDISLKGPITWDDATWILTSAFIIFTMQSGQYRVIQPVTSS